jgi:hypothetical protein
MVGMFKPTTGHVMMVVDIKIPTHPTNPTNPTNPTALTNPGGLHE